MRKNALFLLKNRKNPSSAGGSVPRPPQQPPSPGRIPGYAPDCV